MASKPKPQPPGSGDDSKAARDKTDRQLDKAGKAKTAEGATRRLGRIIRGGR